MHSKPSADFVGPLPAISPQTLRNLSILLGALRVGNAVLVRARHSTAIVRVRALVRALEPSAVVTRTRRKNAYLYVAMARDPTNLSAPLVYLDTPAYNRVRGIAPLSLSDFVNPAPRKPAHKTKKSQSDAKAVFLKRRFGA